MEKLVFNYNKLRGAIREKGFILETLSQATGISMSTLSTKMHRGQKFDTDQAWRIGQVLGLDSLDPYFFDCKLSKLESTK